MFDFQYEICNQADEDLFEKQCKAIEEAIQPLKKQKLLIDVDESKVQEYLYQGKRIRVFNSYYINELYVESEIELTPFFNKKS